MGPSAAVSIVIVISLALGIAGVVRRISLWRRGAPAEAAVGPALLSIPRRYFGDLHAVVSRDRYVAIMHVLAAGGFLLALALVLLVFLLGVSWNWSRWLLAGLLLLMLAGVAMVLVRRRGLRPPSPLSRGDFARLPFSLIAFACGFLLLLQAERSLVAWDLTTILGLMLATIGLAELALASWGGPLKHAFAGALHLAFHPRPDRFAGKHDTALTPVDLQAATLGVGTPSDFAWNRLLGFDACVQCGRCESVCPAFAAGQPLNPKKLVQDLVVGINTGSDKAYRGSPHPQRSVGQAHGAPEMPLVPGLIDPDTVWACTTCRACVYECPMFIEHVDAVVDMRRFLTMERGETPGRGPELLESLRATDNPGGNSPDSRLDWATDLNLKLASEAGSADVLLWLGDAVFDLPGQRTLRALVGLLRAAGVDFAVLGNEELDCGDVARRLGDDATFQSLARRNIETLTRYGVEVVVTADPHALHVIRNEYPALGGSFEVHHHSSFLDLLLRNGSLKLKQPVDLTVSYHDPCYLGRYNGETEAPRQLLQRVGVELREMQRSGMRSRCCGGGGGAPITDVQGERRIADLRMDDARTTGVEVVAVACPNCRIMLEGVVQPRPEVRDIAEIVAAAVAH